MKRRQASTIQIIASYNIIDPAMQEVELYPRYLAHQLRTHLSAALVGKLVETNPKRNSLLLETDPEAKMTVEALLQEADDTNHFEVGKYYEVRGVCRSGKELEVRGHTNFGSDFDMASYNQMLQLATKEFKSIFYS